MNYDPSEIGKIIRLNRKKMKSPERIGKSMNQDELGDLIGRNRKTITDWENGRVIPQLEDMLKMCDIFGCDLGHLLGEYPEKTRVIAEVADQIPLSEEVITKLIQLKVSFSLKDNLTDMYRTTIGLIEAFILSFAPEDISPNSISANTKTIRLPFYLQRIKDAYQKKAAIDLPKDPSRLHDLSILDYERFNDMVQESDELNMVIDANTMRVANEFVDILESYMKSFTSKDQSEV